MKNTKSTSINLKREINIFCSPKYTLMSIVFLSFFLTPMALLHAWEKAIWPFNTPSMVSKQICTNSKDWARSAYYCKDQKSRAELIVDLHDHRNIAINEEPNYREWNIIYYHEIENLIKIVWKNPNITESMAIEITQDSCKARRQSIQKKLEETNPKK